MRLLDIYNYRIIDGHQHLVPQTNRKASQAPRWLVILARITVNVGNLK